MAKNKGKTVLISRGTFSDYMEQIIADLVQDLNDNGAPEQFQIPVLLFVTGSLYALQDKVFE